MKNFRVVQTPNVEKDIRDRIRYIRNELKNPQAARSVWEDYLKTCESLQILADSIQEPSSIALQRR